MFGYGVGVGYYLNIPYSKLNEIYRQPLTQTQKKEMLFHHYLATHPAPSWSHVAEALYKAKEHSALKKVMATYVKGEGAVHTQHTLPVIQPNTSLFHGI